MKVLFAINNENTVNQIIKHYKDIYGEKIDAILKEVMKDIKKEDE